MAVVTGWSPGGTGALGWHGDVGAPGGERDRRCQGRRGRQSTRRGCGDRGLGRVEHKNGCARKAELGEEREERVFYPLQTGPCPAVAAWHPRT